MPFAFEKLTGLNSDALLAAVEPILLAHRVEGVELIWRTDNRGWVLYLTVERQLPGQRGAGVTLDDCSEISRDLSAALDATDVIPGAYRLEVGTPGLERALYRPAEYARFAGELARLRLSQPVAEQRSLRGVLLGLDDEGRVQVDTEQGMFSVPFDAIASANLVFDPDGAKSNKARSKGPGGRKASPRSK